MAENPKLDKDMVHKMQMKTEIGGVTVNHPALSRVKQKLSEAQEISTDNPSMLCIAESIIDITNHNY